MTKDTSEVGTCDRCAKPVTYDLIIPDDAWAMISPSPVEGWKGGGVLCPECIVAALISSLVAENERLTKANEKLERRARHAETRAEKQAKYYRIERSKAETAERLLAEARAGLTRIAAIKYPSTDTHYALKATIDYARDQARASIGGGNG